jgi:hypothetical protein
LGARLRIVLEKKEVIFSKKLKTVFCDNKNGNKQTRIAIILENICQVKQLSSESSGRGWLFCSGMG